MSALKKGLAVVGVSLWVLAVGTGLRMLWQYSTTPGRLAEPPHEFPQTAKKTAKIGPVHDRATLMMFLHPHCPCSRASLGELALILAQTPQKPVLQVLVYRPKGEKSSWANTDLRRSAAEMPGVQVIDDVGGALTRRFGVATSGQVLLYDGRGRLIFNGGITSLRGHSGDNEGREAILALLRGAKPREDQTPVYGCSLVGPDEAQQPAMRPAAERQGPAEAEQEAAQP